MMMTPPDAPLRIRLGERLGPEIIASILVAAVVVVGASVALSWRPSPGTAAGTSPAPSAAAVTSAPAVGASPSPTVSAPALPNTPARAVLEVVDRLLDQRAELEAELGKKGTDAVLIADLLREVNASLVLIQDGPLNELAANPATVDLASRIRTVNEATSDAVRRTQRASISNEGAYREGATEVVAELAPLRGMRPSLAVLAGLPAAP